MALDFLDGVLQASTEYSMIGKDLDGGIVLWKCRGAPYGFTAEEVVGKKNASILHVPEDGAAGLRGEMMAPGS